DPLLQLASLGSVRSRLTGTVAVLDVCLAEPVLQRRFADTEVSSDLFDGSSDIRWGSWGEAAGGEEHAEAIIVAVAEAAGEASVEFDDPVHGFGAAVVRSAGGEVGQECGLPAAQGAAQAGDLGDRAGVERLDDLLRDPSPLGEVLRLVGGAQLLGALPCDEHLVVRFIGLDRGDQPGALLVGEVLGASAEDRLDPVERIARPAAMTEGVLLDPTADLVD